MTKQLVLALGFAFAAQTAFAAISFQTLGSQNYLHGDYTDDVTFANFHTTDPAPFDGQFYGSDLTSNFTQSFTFSAFGGPQFLVSASLSIGLYDHDSFATGNQVFSLTAGAGLIDLTSLLNDAFEADPLVGDTDQIGYYTIFLPSSLNTELATGMITFNLELQNGYGVLGDTAFNGAGLDFATLQVFDTPEPATYVGMLSGLAALVGYRRYRARS